MGCISNCRSWAAALNAFRPQLLFSAGHNVHHEPQSARRIFTASRSDHCASFVIVVTLHYKALG